MKIQFYQREKEIKRTNHTSSEDNSRYLLRRFYDSFAVFSVRFIIVPLFTIRVSDDSLHAAQRRTRQKDKIETKRDQSNSIPNKISPISLEARQTPRKSAALAKVRQIGNHGSYRIKFENAWSNKIKEHASWILRFHESTRIFRGCAFFYIFLYKI